MVSSFPSMWPIAMSDSFVVLMEFVMRRLSCSVPFLLISLCLGGCLSPHRTEKWEVNVGGPVEIDVENFRGDVIIIGMPTRDAAFVRMTRRGTHGYDRREDAIASLNEITTSLDLVPGEYGQRLEVRAETTHAEPHFQRVDIYIEIPSIDGVRAQTDDGDVAVIRAEGAMDIETANGVVTVKTSLPMREPVTIINNAGPIEYVTREESTAAFDVKVVNGDIAHRIDRGDLRVLAGTDEYSFQATLNEGTNPVILRAVDGKIRIKVVREPEAVYTRVLY